MAYTCPNCGHVGSTSRKLSDWEVNELRSRVERIKAENPVNPWRGGRQYRLRLLADEYGINVRTLYRYMERAA